MITTYTIIGKQEDGGISVQWIEARSAREALRQAFLVDLWDEPPIEVFAIFHGEHDCLLGDAGLAHGYAVAQEDLTVLAVAESTS